MDWRLRWIGERENQLRNPQLHHFFIRKCWSLSCVQLYDLMKYRSPQAPLSMELSRQEYWSGLPFPPPGGSSRSRHRTQVSCTTGRFFTVWAPFSGTLPPTTTCEFYDPLHPVKLSLLAYETERKGPASETRHARNVCSPKGGLGKRRRLLTPPETRRCPPETLRPPAAQRGGQEGKHLFPLRPLPWSPSPAPTLLLRLLASSSGTQGSHLAPMVVLRAKETSDCGVSITDNTAPGTLITLPPCVLRAHNQVRGRRSWKHCTSPRGEPCPAPFSPCTCDADSSDAERGRRTTIGQHRDANSQAPPLPSRVNGF